MRLLVIFLISILLISCGDGNTNNSTTNYYSASPNSYYQIITESQNGVESLALSITTSTGNILDNVPLTITGLNTYSFGDSTTGDSNGTLILKNNQMAISVKSGTNTSFADFAIESMTNTTIPDGTYNTVCDQNNISACTVVVNNNQISITEYSVAGTPTNLCQNQTLQQTSGTQNPYLGSFSCGVQGGTNNGAWYVMPITANGVTGIMISEYNPSSTANTSITNEIAFPQAAFTPNGTYNYVYNGISSNSGLTTASFSTAGLVNTVVGSCSGAACALIEGQYAGSIGMQGNTMTGFDYYNINGSINYNLVGSSVMNIFVDSFSGIYF
ncbi:MAG: hypothetical protein K0R49_317 [Burkholderiales bacterium]|jgi:hypothetical protein|nr:hypothetical protein [Burkholderiales bacterium]